MVQTFDASNNVTRDGTPDGGYVFFDLGVGEMPALYIRWQRGPLVDAEGVRHEPNGCFVETVLEAAKQRLEHYQTTKFRCVENVEMIGHIDAALEAARDRTRRREERGVEGTSEV